MKAAGTNFFSLMRELLPKHRLIPASACLMLLLGSASQVQAQSVAGITGIAGFETGFQVIASVDLAHVSQFGDVFPPGATIGWGDGSSETGLLSCTGGEKDPCLVLGPHWYPSQDVLHNHSSFDPGYQDFIFQVSACAFPPLSLEYRKPPMPAHPRL